MSRKYSMILVNRVMLDTGEACDVCRLVKALPEADKLNFADLTEVSLTTEDDLISAAKDTRRDGVSTWHYDNGKFCADESGTLVWNITSVDKPSEDSDAPCDQSSQRDEELYAVYGGD